MNFVNTINKMNESEDFKSKPYDFQVRVKHAAFEAALKEDPTLGQFTPEALQDIYTKVVHAAPRLSNPQAQAQLQDLVNRVDSGNDPEADQKYKDVYKNINYFHDNMFASTAGRALTNLTRAVTGRTSFNDQPGVDDLIIGTDDEHKVRQYLNLRDSTSRVQLTGLEKAQGTFASLLTDVIGFGALIPVASAGVAGVAAPILERTAIASGQKLATSGVADMVRSIPKLQVVGEGAKTAAKAWLTKTLLAEGIESAAIAGPLSVAMGTMQANANKEPESSPFASIENFSSNYFLGMAFDVGISTLTRNALPAIIYGTKYGLMQSVSSKDLGKLADRQANMRAGIEAFAKGETESDALMKELSPYAQAGLENNKQLLEISAIKGKDLNDSQRFILGTSIASPDITVVAKADGKYDVWRATKKDMSADISVTKVEAENLMEAQDMVAQHITSNKGVLQQAIANPNYEIIINKYTPWVKNWDNSRTAAARALEAHVVTTNKGDFSQRLPIAERPWIGNEELTNSPVTAIPVQLAYDKKTLDRLKANKQGLNYDDLAPMQMSKDKSNAVILSAKPKELSKADYDADPLTQSMEARKDGFDSLVLKDADGNTTAYVPLAPSALKLVTGDFDLQTGRLASQTINKLPKVNTEAGLTAQVYQTMNKTLKASEFGATPHDMVRFGVGAFRGKINPANVTLFAKALTQNDTLPVKINVGGRANTLADGSSVKIEAVGDTLEITIPATINSAAATKRFIGELSVGMGLLEDPRFNAAGASVSNRINHIMSKAVVRGDDIVDKLFSVGSPQGKLLTRVKLDEILTDLNLTMHALPDGTFHLKLADREVVGTIFDIFKAVRPYLMPKKAIAEALSHQGLRYSVIDGLFIVKNQSKKVVGTYRSLDEMMQAHAIEVRSLPAKYRPLVVEVDPTGSTASIFSDSGNIRLSKKESIDLMSSFEREEALESTFLLKGKQSTMAIDVRPSTIEFIDEATQSKLVFASVDEAKAFAKVRSTYAGLSEIAASKGMKIDYSNGTYKVFLRGKGAFYVAKNLEEVEQALTDTKTKAFDAKELFPEVNEILAQLPPDLLRQWTAFRRDLDPIKTDMSEKFNDVWVSGTTQMGANWNRIFNTITEAIGKLNRAGKIPPDYMKAINEQMAALKLYHAQTAEALQKLADIFKINGKAVRRDRAELMQIHLGSTNKLETQKAHPLTDAELKVVDDVRAFLGERTETGVTGLGGMYGISVAEYINGYTHHALSYVDSKETIEAAMRKATTVEGVIEALTQGGFKDTTILRDMKASFEFSRKNDIMAAIFEKSAISSTMYYITAGMRKRYLNVSSQNLAAMHNTYAKQLTPDAASILTRFRDNMTGNLQEDIVGDAIKNVAYNFASKIGPILHKITKDDKFISPQFARGAENIVNDLTTLSYVTLLGARPMTAIRNIAQVYTMVGPAVGMRYLAETNRWMGTASEAGKASVVTRMKQGAVLTSNNQFIEFTQLGSNLQRFANFAMKMFKNADEYTRFLAYGSTHHRFAEAVEKLQRGDFGTDESAKELFFNYSKLSLFQKNDKDFVDRMWATINPTSVEFKTGRFNKDDLTFSHEGTARVAHLLSDKIVELTLFNYSAWNKPMIFQMGTIGKLAGQLGMFSASYRNYISHMLTNLNKAEALEFLGSFIGTNLAFFAAFQIAQVKTNDFVPFLPGVSGIGPMFESMFTIAEALTPSAKPSTSFGSLAKAASPIVMKKQTVDRPDEITSEYPVYPTATYKDLAFQVPSWIPGSVQWYYGNKALEYFKKGDTYRGIMSLTTANMEADWQNDLTVNLPFIGQQSIKNASPSFFAQKLTQKPEGQTPPEYPGP